MSTQQFQVHLVRVDRSRNMCRFYRVSIEPTLFGDYAVGRGWGRVGSRGRLRIDLFAEQSQALQHFLDMVRQKRGRGYKPRPLQDGSIH
ncbi:WGR domain-containing protein [Neorhizobium sp. AL 9.2.2]|uniref:WGR domain-containing protein n=1 Tax=Neorhizobium sp. AL 9.2.2 TaxID=2712894 RepID=UPI0015729AC1|nr:WGR domain-containing protein [Neorhizobium sp. AL 9.2.2]NSY20201.1 WGR domain-containing protein [Neorhizobium sp. AL 9.2.2]